MPSLSAEKTQEIMRAIRDTLVADPLISMPKLSDALASRGYRGIHGTGLDRIYLGKLVKKVNGQRKQELDTTTKELRVMQLRDRYRLIVGKLLSIAFFDPARAIAGQPIPSYKDQIAACREIMKWDIALLNAEMDVGIFERHIGTLELERRNRPVPQYKLAEIQETLHRWGFILPAPGEPAAVEVPNIMATEIPTHGKTFSPTIN